MRSLIKIRISSQPLILSIFSADGLSWSSHCYFISSNAISARQKKHTLIGQGCICKAWAGWASLKTASWRKDDHHKTSPQPPGTSGSHSSCTYHSCRALSSHLALWGPHLLNWGSHFMGSDKSGRPPDNTFLILLFSYWQLCQCFSHENKIPKAPTVQLH